MKFYLYLLLSLTQLFAYDASSLKNDPAAMLKIEMTQCMSEFNLAKLFRPNNPSRKVKKECQDVYKAYTELLSSQKEYFMHHYKTLSQKQDACEAFMFNIESMYAKDAKKAKAFIVEKADLVLECSLTTRLAKDKKLVPKKKVYAN